MISMTSLRPISIGRSAGNAAVRESGFSSISTLVETQLAILGSYPRACADATTSPIRRRQSGCRKSSSSRCLIQRPFARGRMSDIGRVADIDRLRKPRGHRLAFGHGTVIDNDDLARNGLGDAALD